MHSTVNKTSQPTIIFDSDRPRNVPYHQYSFRSVWDGKEYVSVPVSKIPTPFEMSIADLGTRIGEITTRLEKSPGNRTLVIERQRLVDLRNKYLAKNPSAANFPATKASKPEAPKEDFEELLSKIYGPLD